MGKITSTLELKNSIRELEQKQEWQWIALREEANQAVENLKPANLIKNALNHLSSTDGLMDNIINSLVGISSGFVSKKLFVGKSHNIFRNILGSLVQAFITNGIIKHPQIIKSVSSRIIDKIFGKKEAETREYS